MILDQFKNSRDIFYEIISIRHKTANYSKNLCPNMIDLIWFPNQITRYDLIKSRKQLTFHINTCIFRI